MERNEEKNSPRAVITVFFTLMSVLYLALLFILIESVRMQGARAHTEQIARMGNCSLFSEYEQKLLADFDVLGLDGSYGTGDFHIDRINERLTAFLEKNADPNDGLVKSLCFEPWKIKLTDSTVTDYSLLSDGKGEAFYQQAVAYMRTTAITQVGWKLLRWYRLAQKEEEKQEIYEQEKLSADKELEDLEQQEKECREELERRENEDAEGQPQSGPDMADTAQNEPGTSDAVQGGSDTADSGKNTAGPAAQAGMRIENPIPALQKLRRKDLLTILCPGQEISSGSVRRGELTSGRFTRKGTMPVERTFSGPLNDLFFKEYLLDHFTCFREEEKEGDLKYELEYLLGGKKEDRKNLKAAAYRLLLLREGSNYLYCSSDEGMSAAAGGLAMLLIGWTQIPELTAVLKHLLLLGWAYAESLLDVRAVMSGGRVEVLKDETTWNLKLEDLAHINELLEQNAGNQKSGLTYRGYLRLLLYLQPVSEQKKRAVDLVELRVKAGDGLEEFRADYCVTGIRAETEWMIPPMFSSVTGALLGTGAGMTTKEVHSTFSYF